MNSKSMTVENFYYKLTRIAMQIVTKCISNK